MKRWSASINLGYDVPASSTMHATWNEFVNNFYQDYHIASYPFGDENTVAISAGARVAYQIGRKPKIFLGWHYNYFQTTSDYKNDGSGKQVITPFSATLSASTFTLGVEYVPTAGTPSGITPFLRAGLNASIIGGNIHTQPVLDPYDPNTSNQANRIDDITIHTTTRFGLEAEAGAYFIFPSSPFALEFSLNYTNLNAFKSAYESPAQQPPKPITEIGLNDGVNSNHPEDRGRAISFISFRIGIGYTF